MTLVRLLVPPYRQVSWVADGPPPLGAIALASASSVEQVSGGLKPLLKRAPWCVPCLVTATETATPTVLAAIHELPGQPVFLPGPLPVAGSGPVVVGAVRARPVPGGARLADFVVRRTGRPDLRLDLAALLGGETGEFAIVPPPERTLRDRLRRFGSFGTLGWRAVGTLCRAAARSERGSVERIATGSGIGARTLRAWVRRYLQVSMAEFRARAGWEWAMEAALRAGGYVATPEWGRPFTLRPPRSIHPLAEPLRPSRRSTRRVPDTLVTEIRPIELSDLKAPAP
jgi:hypothetical protein